MYRQIVIPNGHINILIPREWWGQKVEVTVSPIKKDTDEEQSLLAKRKKLDETLDKYPIDYADVQQVLKLAKEEDVQKIKKVFANYQFDMKDFKFDRDEANNYD